METAFNLLKSIVQSDAGSFGSMFAIFVLIFYLIHYVTKKITLFQTKVDKTDDLDKKIDSKYDRIENKFENIRADIHIIRAQLETFKTNSNPLAKRKSPISLSQKGIEVAEEIHVTDIINNHWNCIEQSLKQELKEDCNPYDIQVASFKMGNLYTDFINNEELDKIKNNAFENGLSIDTYSLLFGVIIRDKMLGRKAYSID